MINWLIQPYNSMWLALSIFVVMIIYAMVEIIFYYKKGVNKNV